MTECYNTEECIENGVHVVDRKV